MRECMEEVKNLIKAKIQCMWIETYEEEAVIKDLKEICADENYKLKAWSHTSGLQTLPLTMKEKAANPDRKVSIEGIFRVIDEASEKGKDNVAEKDEALWIIKDLHLLNDTHQVKRIIRDIKEKPTYSYNPIIVISPIVQIPLEHEKLFTVIHYDEPSKAEIKRYLDKYVNKLQKAANAGKNIAVPTEEEQRHILNACAGLTMNQIKDTLAKSIVKYNGLQLKAIMDEKIQLVKKSGVLDYIVPKISYEDIGGNHDLKKWISEVEDSMSEDAISFGCKPAKGYLAVGIPGTSKSAMAEATASKWGIPLLKLSMNRIMDKLVGNSEKKIDQAFRVAKACAPCVLLWDEVEKMLGGIKSSNSSDSGTTSRVFAAALQFLQEPNGVFNIMTSNDISQLPPEFTRAGRLDAIWYFSLPSNEERREIFRIHLGKTNKEVSEELINFCADQSEHFTGAEIEQSVIAGMRKAFKRFKQDGNNAITEGDMGEAIEEVVPLYESSRERIAWLENWAKGKARYTNSETHSDDFDVTKNVELIEDLKDID